MLLQFQECRKIQDKKTGAHAPVFFNYSGLLPSEALVISSSECSDRNVLNETLSGRVSAQGNISTV